MLGSLSSHPPSLVKASSSAIRIISIISIMTWSHPIIPTAREVRTTTHDCITAAGAVLQIVPLVWCGSECVASRFTCDEGGAGGASGASGGRRWATWGGGSAPLRQSSCSSRASPAIAPMASMPALDRLDMHHDAMCRPSQRRGLGKGRWGVVIGGVAAREKSDNSGTPAGSRSVCPTTGSQVSQCTRIQGMCAAYLIISSIVHLGVGGGSRVEGGIGCMGAMGRGLWERGNIGGGPEEEGLKREVGKQ